MILVIWFFVFQKYLIPIKKILNVNYIYKDKSVSCHYSIAIDMYISF